jgi:phosphohistidine phosphatase SixA
MSTRFRCEWDNRGRSGVHNWGRSTPTVSSLPGQSLVATVLVVVLGLTGCSLLNRREPLASVSPAGPSTTLATPSPIITTIGPPSGGATTVRQPGSTRAPAGQGQWTFVVVRHANWKDDGSPDPPLTRAGKLRALRLADLLFSYAGVATYATQFRRAKDTARPTAELWKVPVSTYDAALPPADLINQIKRDHPAGAVLIVGHSDTLPGIIEELCRCQIDPIPESDYAPRYQIALRPDGTVLSVQRDAGY